jgi:hypothetical protein
MVQFPLNRENEVIFDESFRLLCEISSVKILSVVEYRVQMCRAATPSDFVDEVFESMKKLP